jgi:hypothetical protein
MQDRRQLDHPLAPRQTITEHIQQMALPVDHSIGGRPISVCGFGLVDGETACLPALSRHNIRLILR